jgi:hypothetical protein
MLTGRTKSTKLFFLFLKPQKYHTSSTSSASPNLASVNSTIVPPPLSPLPSFFQAQPNVNMNFNNLQMPSASVACITSTSGARSSSSPRIPGVSAASPLVTATNTATTYAPSPNLHAVNAGNFALPPLMTVTQHQHQQQQHHHHHQDEHEQHLPSTTSSPHFAGMKPPSPPLAVNYQSIWNQQNQQHSAEQQQQQQQQQFQQQSSDSNAQLNQQNLQIQNDEQSLQQQQQQQQLPPMITSTMKPPVFPASSYSTMITPPITPARSMLNDGLGGVGGVGEQHQQQQQMQFHNEHQYHHQQHQQHVQQQSGKDQYKVTGDGADGM